MSADTAQSHNHLVDLNTTVAPDFVAHWVVKTARSKEMIAWYRTVFGARVVLKNQKLAFLTWDEESHRLALVKVPSFMRYAFPLAKLRRKFYGVDHIGLSFRSLERLLLTYERLKKVGITPVWSINHGPTTSLYYEDPDGIRLEFQTENFPTAGETAQYFCSSAFAENPIGVNIDPDYLLERLLVAPRRRNCSGKVQVLAPAPMHVPTSAPSPGKPFNSARRLSRRGRRGPRRRAGIVSVQPATARAGGAGPPGPRQATPCRWRWPISLHEALRPYCWPRG